MLTFVLVYLGGVLTIFSPCVLPVIPFLFAKSDQPFRRSGLPMLVGMGFSFAFFAALSILGGRLVIQANQFGRYFALGLFAVLGLSLLFSKFAEQLTKPFVRLGAVLQKRADREAGMAAPFLLGASVGLLWAPCAGPILGLVLAGASLGASVSKTFILLLIFAMGAATSLGVAILASGKVLRFLKRGLGAEEWIKRAIGVLVLGGVVAIALGLDTKILSQLRYFNTGGIEQRLIDQISPRGKAPQKTDYLGDEGPAPSLSGADEWLNSVPLTIASLQGKVVLVDFWTYSCINCLRTLPYLKSWSEKYRTQGLVIIGVHTPEFAFEKEAGNVREALGDLHIDYPVAIDNQHTIWKSFKNQYWPAHYFIDGKGRLRHHHFGEGGYEESERVIQNLLMEVPGYKPTSLASLPADLPQTGVEAAASKDRVFSHETYLGFQRQKGFSSSPNLKRDAIQNYLEPPQLALNQWGLSGAWKVETQFTSLHSNRGALAFRFRARDLHLVMGKTENDGSVAVSFRVTIDGHAPGADHGQDTDESGRGVVRSHRLYQLIRQKNNDGEHLFRIEFLGPGAKVFAFTFG